MAGKELAVVLAVIAMAAVMFNHAAAPEQNEFQLWKQKFGVKYESMFEEAYRERIFLENLAEIKLHNSNEWRTYDQGINQFTAMTQEEFEQNYLGLIADQPVITEQNNDY